MPYDPTKPYSTDPTLSPEDRAEVELWNYQKEVFNLAKELFIALTTSGIGCSFLGCLEDAEAALVTAHNRFAAAAGPAPGPATSARVDNLQKRFEEAKTVLDRVAESAGELIQRVMRLEEQLDRVALDAAVALPLKSALNDLTSRVDNLQGEVESLDSLLTKVGVRVNVLEKLGVDS